MDTFGWVEALGNNLRSAARRLRRGPGFTAVAILTLAVGIDANVAAFTYPHSERLVRVFDDLRGSDSRDPGMSAPHENRVSDFHLTGKCKYATLLPGGSTRVASEGKPRFPILQGTLHLIVLRTRSLGPRHAHIGEETERWRPLSGLVEKLLVEES